MEDATASGKHQDGERGKGKDKNAEVLSRTTPQHSAPFAFLSLFSLSERRTCASDAAVHTTCEMDKRSWQI
jgi:hypothetical protein